MGNTTTRLPLLMVCTTPVSHSTQVENDKTAVTNYVANGGCLKDFLTAMGECHPELGAGKDVGACVNAPAALRRCFAATPAMFKHMYLKRMDEGLDEDRKPSPEQVKEESKMFRWWSGMRRI